MPAGSLLAREGQPTERLVLVLHGSAQVSRRLPLQLADAVVGGLTGSTRPLFAVLKEREMPEAEFVGAWRRLLPSTAQALTHGTGGTPQRDTQASTWACPGWRGETFAVTRYW